MRRQVALQRHSLLYEFLPILPTDMWWLVTVVLEVVILFAKALTVAVGSLYRAILSIAVRTLALLAAWVLGALVTYLYLDIFSLYFIFTLFALIFVNLGERKPGELSAYSVFNDGFEELLGTLNAQQFDREIRHLDRLPREPAGAEGQADGDAQDYYIPSESDVDSDIDDDSTGQPLAATETLKALAFEQSLRQRCIAHKIRFFVASSAIRSDES